MHCQAIPSNLDRPKQASSDSTALPCRRRDEIDPLTDDAVERADLLIAIKAP